MFNKVNGKRRRPDPTKGQIEEKSEMQYQQLQAQLQRLIQMTGMQLQQLSQRLMDFERKAESLSYSYLALSKYFGKKFENFDKDIEEAFNVVRLESFELASKKDDDDRKLIAVPAGYKSQMGDVITVKLEAYNPKTNALMTEFTMFRSKVDIGRGELMDIEQHLIGLSAGETKEFTITLSPAFGRFAGTEIKFKVEVFDVKQIPVPPPPAPTVAPPAPSAPAVEETKKEEIKKEVTN
jgi:hypothetical protein